MMMEPRPNAWLPFPAQMLGRWIYLRFSFWPKFLKLSSLSKLAGYSAKDDYDRL